MKGMDQPGSSSAALKPFFVVEFLRVHPKDPGPAFLADSYTFFFTVLLGGCLILTIYYFIKRWLSSILEYKENEKSADIEYDTQQSIKETDTLTSPSIVKEYPSNINSLAD